MTTNATPEVLTGPAYELKPSSRFRHRLKPGRCRLFVAELVCGVPDGEFVVVQRGYRFRCKREGALSTALVYCKLQPYGDINRQRERLFYPVRILSMEPEKSVSA